MADNYRGPWMSRRAETMNITDISEEFSAFHSEPK